MILMAARGALCAPARHIRWCHTGRFPRLRRLTCGRCPNQSAHLERRGPRRGTAGVDRPRVKPPHARGDLAEMGAPGAPALLGPRGALQGHLRPGRVTPRSPLAAGGPRRQRPGPRCSQHASNWLPQRQARPFFSDPSVRRVFRRPRLSSQLSIVAQPSP